MIEWLVPLALILMLAALLVWGFVGCTLDDTPLVGVSELSIFVSFDPALGAANGSFTVLLDLVSDADPEQLSTPLRAENEEPEAVDGLLPFEFHVILSPGGYRLTCQVFAYDGDVPLNEGAPIVGPAECHATMPGAGDITFEAGLGQDEFDVTGCN